MKNQTQRNRTVIYIIGILLLALIVWRVAPKVIGTGGRQQMSRPPVAVEVGQVTTGPIRDVREFTGTITPIYQYVVAPKVTGRVLTIRKRIGDFVRRGEEIARIDDAEYQQAVIEAEANLRIANASLNEANSQFALATQELERAQSLKEKGIASPAELETAQTSFTARQSQVTLSQAQVEQRQAALRTAQIRLGYTILQATEAGYIGERFVDEGQLLSPNTAVATVVGLDSVIVLTTIIERDYGLMRPGQAAEIEVDAYPGQIFAGTVSRIAPMLDENSRVAQMEIGVSNRDRTLKPGMFARVRVILESKDSARIIPTTALVSQNGTDGVFLVDQAEKTARFVQVTKGIVTKDNIEITEPQIEGIVVTLGQHLLSDGSPVVLPGENQESGAGNGPRGGQGGGPRQGRGGAR
jgi:RND family efflux transporter MFP subunit